MEIKGRRKKSSNNNEDQFYEVEKILDIRYPDDQSVEYLVRWKGFEAKDDNWETEENVESCRRLVENFLAEYIETNGQLPARLKESSKRSSLSKSTTHNKRKSKMTPFQDGIWDSDGCLLLPSEYKPKAIVKPRRLTNHFENVSISRIFDDGNYFFRTVDRHNNVEIINPKILSASNPELIHMLIVYLLDHIKFENPFSINVYIPSDLSNNCSPSRRALLNSRGTKRKYTRRNSSSKKMSIGDTDGHNDSYFDVVQPDEAISEVYSPVDIFPTPVPKPVDIDLD